MNLSQIEYFLAVAEQLNFTSAAKSLYVSQPALSKQIAMLEEELGTKLFVRNSRKVSLTDAGRKFEQDLKEIHLSLENAKKNVMENGRQEQRTVRIGCFDGVVIRDFLPKFYRHIQENAPILQTTLVRGRFEENRLALEEDRIDILFTLDIEFPGGSEYKTQRLIRRNGALIYARELIDREEEEVEIRDFKDIPLLLLRKSLAPKLYENELNNLKKIGIENPKILEVENMATLRAHLEMGLGYSVLTADVDIGSKMQKYLLPEENGTWVIAVWKKDRSDIDALMDGLQM